MKCIIIFDAFNLHSYPIRMEKTSPSSHICSTDKNESTGIIVNENFSRSCSTDEDESKGIIVNKSLFQSCTADEEELCSMEEDKSGCTIKRQKDTNNEVTYDVTN